MRKPAPLRSDGRKAIWHTSRNTRLPERQVGCSLLKPQTLNSTAPPFGLRVEGFVLRLYMVELVVESALWFLNRGFFRFSV